jgi:PhnB protein
MKPAYTPENYSTVSPYLVVNGANATIAFLKRAFGATVQARHVDTSGLVRHSEVCISECVVMISDPVPPDWPSTAAHVHLFVRDVDAAYRRALEAGATPVQAPVQKPDDKDKQGGVKDDGGTTWWISGRVEK